MNKLIVPIFSMRSYKTGLYSVLKDGNFQLHLSRAKPGDIICIPFNTSDSEDLLNLFPELFFVQIQYFKNALETREHFWSINTEVINEIFENNNIDVIVTDITGYKGYPVIFNFNITKDSNIKRDYIDKFFDLDVKSVNNSLKTFVLNESQKNELVKGGADGNKIIICKKVINPSVINRLSEGDPIEIDGVFHPFRLSDKCYDFDSVKTYCNLVGVPLYITDPNDTFVNDSEFNIKKIKPSKNEYYRILKSRPWILYNENPEKVFHPGLAEFIYFDADIDCKYKIPDRNDVVIDLGEDVWQT